MGENMVVFGAGAVGSCIAAYMTKAGDEIVLIDPWFAHIVSIQNAGLHVRDPEGEFTVNPRALHLDQVKNLGKPIDILFLAVKSPDTEWSCRYLVPYMAPDGVIISAQNSLNEEVISSIVGPERTIGMVISIFAAIYEPGKLLRHSTVGKQLDFEVGELDGRDTPRIRDLTILMSKVGKSRFTKNIWGALWAKLASNSMTNCLAGLTGLGYGDMYNNAFARSIMMKIGKEVIEVGEAHGVKFDKIGGTFLPENFKNLDKGGAQIIEKAMLRNAISSEKVPGRRYSLLQDILKARRTEVDYLNGIVVRKGHQKGVSTPVNQAVLDLVHKVEEGKIKPDPSNLNFFKRFV